MVAYIGWIILFLDRRHISKKTRLDYMSSMKYRPWYRFILYIPCDFYFFLLEKIKYPNFTIAKLLLWTAVWDIRIFGNMFSSPSPTWDDTTEADHVVIPAATLGHYHLLGCVGISPCSDIGEDEIHEIQRKIFCLCWSTCGAVSGRSMLLT